MERDVFIKVDDAVQWGLTEEGDETTTDGWRLMVSCGGKVRNRMRATSTWSVNAAARAIG